VSADPTAFEGRLQAVERGLELLRSPVVRGQGEDAVLPPVGVIADFLSADSSPELSSRAALDDLPIPDDANREGYRLGNHRAYWQMGLDDYDKVLRAAHERSITAGRFYDFGGSTGRVFRHAYCQTSQFQVWSSDFKLPSALWNQRHMPRGIRCFLNGFNPPLPLPDRYFDVVTAFSVFTHIDELELAWLLELRRVLKPGGLLYLTVHDEAFWERIPPQLLEVLQRSAGGEGLTAQSPFPDPRAAFHFTTEGYYSCNVFHSHAYIREQWGRYFNSIEIRPLGAEKQCAVLLSYGD